MTVLRRWVVVGLVGLVGLAVSQGIGLRAEAASLPPEQVVRTWYRLIVELVRHTPTYSPPVASRTFGYVGVTAFEAVASGSDDLQSLAGQLNGLTPVPPRAAGMVYDNGVVLHAALSDVTHAFFDNTGPSGQRAMAVMDRALQAQVVQDLPPDVVVRSAAYGRAVAAHILDWSRDDGGAAVENMGFPLTYVASDDPARWVPTSKVAQQQAPLLPDWGQNRPFVLPNGDACPLPPPVAYSEDKGSAFYAQAMEVYETKANLTPEQRAIARFWSDDAMLSTTPPGHWVAIAWQVLEDEGADLDRVVEVQARLGVALADAFIGCWATKYQYVSLRPVTYIRRVIDPKWESTMVTPPFPEYPSGHSTQSAAAAAVLAAMFGADRAFEDASHADDGLPPRRFAGFAAAAEEAALSRLYGGIHFRGAVEQGLAQGRCIGGHAVALRMRRS